MSIGRRGRTAAVALGETVGTGHCLYFLHVLKCEVSPYRIRFALRPTPCVLVLDGEAAVDFLHRMMPRCLSLLYQLSIGDRKTARRAGVYWEGARSRVFSHSRLRDRPDGIGARQVPDALSARLI